ncbi:hypothetical protein HZB88_04625 [archaeon]|nr:hypothetical protein [archaeon]
MKRMNILHYPRLDTVLMVERLIYSTSGTYMKKQLWQKLPKKVMYQTFSLIIDYLLETGRIGIDRKGKICWIWDPKGTRRYLRRKDLAWKSSQE